MIRLTFLVRRQKHLTQEAFQSYWLNTHGPLVASHATDLGIMRYVQNHTMDDSINQAMNQARGGAMETPYDGVAELWWENEEVLMGALQSEAGKTGGQNCSRTKAASLIYRIHLYIWLMNIRKLTQHPKIFSLAVKAALSKFTSR